MLYTDALYRQLRQFVHQNSYFLLLGLKQMRWLLIMMWSCAKSVHILESFAKSWSIFKLLKLTRRTTNALRLQHCQDHACLLNSEWEKSQSSKEGLLVDQGNFMMPILQIFPEGRGTKYFQLMQYNISICKISMAECVRLERNAFTKYKRALNIVVLNALFFHNHNISKSINLQNITFSDSHYVV